MEERKIAERAEAELLKLGVNPAYKGFKYIVCAMELIEINEDYLHSMVHLYTAVAVHYDTATTSQVERCIRNAIVKAPNIAYRLGLPYSVKVCNSSVITALYMQLKSAKRSGNSSQAHNK